MIGRNPILTKIHAVNSVIVEYGALMEAAQPEDRKSVPNTKSYMPEKMATRMIKVTKTLIASNTVKIFFE